MPDIFDTIKNAVKEIDMDDIAKAVDIADDFLDKSSDPEIVKVEGMPELIKTVSDIKMILAAVFKTISEEKK